jgi:hypothetical protein
VSLLLAGEDPFTAQVGAKGEKIFSVLRAEQEADAGKPHRLLLYFLALPGQGVRLRLESEGSGPIEVEYADMSYDLPRGLDIPPAPSGILLHPRTLVRGHAQLPGLSDRE